MLPPVLCVMKGIGDCSAASCCNMKVCSVAIPGAVVSNGEVAGTACPPKIKPRSFAKAGLVGFRFA